MPKSNDPDALAIAQFGAPGEGIGGAVRVLRLWGCEARSDRQRAAAGLGSGGYRPPGAPHGDDDDDDEEEDVAGTSKFAFHKEEHGSSDGGGGMSKKRQLELQALAEAEAKRKAAMKEARRAARAAAAAAELQLSHRHHRTKRGVWVSTATGRAGVDRQRAADAGEPLLPVDGARNEAVFEGITGNCSGVCWPSVRPSS